MSFLQGAIILVAGHQGTMMLGYEIAQAPGKAVFFCQFQTISDMAENGSGTFLRREIVMRIYLVGRLVLHEKERIGCFADVVEKSTDAGEQRVCPNPLSSLFSHICHQQAVLIGTGGSL